MVDHAYFDEPNLMCDMQYPDLVEYPAEISPSWITHRLAFYPAEMSLNLGHFRAVR